MRKLIFILACFYNHSAYAQGKILYYTQYPLGFASTKISKQQLKNDIASWQNMLEETHVNPYHAISKKDLEELEKNILQSLPDSMSHAKACFVISELIGSLNEGHLGFATNRICDSLYAFHSLRFPYLLQDIDENGCFVVEKDLSKEKRLSALSRIIEVNGIPAKILYEKYRKFNGGLEAWRRLMTKNSIRKLLYLDGIKSPFQIKAIQNNDTINFSVNGFNKQEADSINRALAVEQTGMAPFSLGFLDNNIALIAFNDMNRGLKDSFALFLKQSFTTIKEKQATGLIIDLRRNGGGDSYLGEMLISYISNKKYRMTGGMKFKMSQHYKTYTESDDGISPFAKWENGKIYTYKSSKLKRPTANPLRYEGNVCVLIGTGTFSSANMLTNAIKDYSLAKLIGESTAEPGNDFGEIFYFMLPNTHIVAGTACKMFIRANGDKKDFEGIKPDIEVKNTPADIQQKKDRVLKTAVEWILKDLRRLG